MPPRTKNIIKRPIGNYYHQVIPRHVKSLFRNNVIDAAGVSAPAFYDWMNGITTPNKATQRVIIDALNKVLPEGEGVTDVQVIFGAYEQVK